MRAASLFLVALLEAGLTACSPSSHYVVTDGSSKRLPPKNARVAVWGLRPVVTNTVVAWLEERGLAVMEPATLQEAFDKEHIRVSRSFADEQNAVRVARQLGIELVIFTQSAIGETVVGSMGTTTAATPFPGPVSTTFSSASVALRGVEVASGELVLNGTAKYPQQLAAAGQDTLAVLACKALETAWGLVPPGEQAFSTDEPCLSAK